MYGTQTHPAVLYSKQVFENDVKMYGTQTDNSLIEQQSQFENDVKMYGTQTGWQAPLQSPCLRMM